LFETKLLEELASPTIPLGGLAGDPSAFQLIECVSKDTRDELRRQPVCFYGGKTDLYVAYVRPEV
jgi:hypothetical protein